MAKPTIITNGNDTATGFEDPKMGTVAVPIPDGMSVGTLGAGMSAETETEYEQVGNLNFNLKRPEMEARNDAPNEAMGVTSYEEFGSIGANAETEAADQVAVDAIFGSYSDLADRSISEVIIGPDNRVRINPTTTYPWRAICSLKITAANGKKFIGTGWLVSPRTVITAGHCVYMHDEGGWAKSIEVIPALNDAARPYGTYVGTVLRSTVGWVQSKNREYDYGAIILPVNSRPGSVVGTFGLAVRDDNFLKAAALNLSGYPGDKGGNQQWFMAQAAKAVSARVITYDIDTFGGQSGAPVWVLQNGVRYGVGIHTNGAASGNSATRIENSAFTNLVNWKNQGL
jgi:V8-like Glu-specific endopeptidase